MSLNRFSMVVLGVAGILTCRIAFATTITHTNYPDFQNGLSDGVVMAMQETTSGTPASGAVGLLPGFGSVIINDEFNQGSVAAAAANYLFLMPNTADYPELATYPSQFLFSGDTPTAPEATAPPAGVLRIHASRPQDFFHTGNVGQRSPLLAINNTVLTGDWIAETKLTEQQLRSSENYRDDGLFIGVPTIDGGKAIDVPLDATTSYLTAGPFSNGYTDFLATVSRLYGGYPTEYANRSFTGETWYIRVVKRGAYFYSYMKNAETAPWVFQQYVKMPELAAAPGLVVGVFAKSFAGGTRYQDDDFEYLKVTRIGALSGAYTNVFDAGAQVNWQTVSLSTKSKQGLKYQLRTGNTLASGTLTDAGAFVGPDGTSATFYTDDAAQVAPNTTGRQYLEYRLLMDGAASPVVGDMTPINLPPFLTSISATYQPYGLASSLLSTATDFGADAGSIETQPGGGDLSLARTQLFRDDFATATLDSGWAFDPGYTTLDPSVVGDYSLTDRAGYLRFKVGYPQDFYDGANKYGAVKMLRDLPSGIDPNNFEIETEVNMENQQCREACLQMAQDQNNFVGVAVGRRFENVYEIGVLEDTVLNNTAAGPIILDYGSNTVQLRVSKQGTYVTVSVRDPASASPSWRVVSIRNTAGAATGGTDFTPIKIGLMSKSYTKADEGTVNCDYNYFRVSNIATSGQKDVTLTLPASTRPDALIAFGDGLTASNAKAQVKNAGGTFVGPDGTAASFFTVNEPKLPAGLDGITSTAVRVLMSGSPASGMPYLHAAGLQYATGTTRVARDTNASDFAAGTANNISTATAGIIANGGNVTTGNPQTENFDTAPSGWLFSNTPPGGSTFSFTDSPGNARMSVQAPCDTWGGATATTKPRCFLYYGTPLTGDFELETRIDMPNGRDQFRHMGLGIIAPLAGGTPPDTNLDTTNLLCFGPYMGDQIRFLRGDNDAFADFGPGGYTGTNFYLRLRKTGVLFTGWVSTDGSAWTQIGTYTFSHTMPTVYVGFFSKAWYLASGLLPLDFDYFKVSQLTTNGTFDSRVLDLGVSGLTPRVESLGGNSALAQVQFRAADTTAALASQTYVGSDGTSTTYFNGDYTGALPASFTGKRYFQYRATIPQLAQINDIAIVGASVTVPLSRADATNALRIAGGLQTSNATDLSRLDVVKGTSAGKIGVEDAVSILKTVSGL